MDNIGKRVEGAAEEFGGKIEKKVGRLINDEQLEADGRAHELVGHDRKESAKAGERIKGKLEEVSGAVEKRVGAAFGSDVHEAKGKARELKGEARQKANQPAPPRKTH